MLLLLLLLLLSPSIYLSLSIFLSFFNYQKVTTAAAVDEGFFEGMAQRVLAALAGVCPRVLYVPGNHDPPAMFAAEDDANVHGRVLQLAPGLHVAGWGGSVQAVEAGQVVWQPYPCPDEALPARLEHLQAAVAALPDSDRVILLTHNGPAGSSTALVTGPDPNSLTTPGLRANDIYTGSAALRALLTAPATQARCVLNVHGHTHQALGLARLGGVPVLNPGSLPYTRSFAHLTLVRSTPTSPWNLDAVSFKLLPG